MKRFFLILVLFLGLYSCAEEEPPITYEVVPVAEITSIYFNDIDNVRLHTFITTDGVTVQQTWDIPFRGHAYGCNLLKWTGEGMEYIEGQEITFEFKILFDLPDDNIVAYTPLEIVVPEIYRLSTWAKGVIEVRNVNVASDRFVGIEDFSYPPDGIFQVPPITWTVGDFSNVPGNQASPNSGARIAGGFEKYEPCECEWILIDEKIIK